MTSLVVLFLVVANTAVFATTRTSGDATVTGAMGAGTLTPRAGMEIGMQGSDDYALKASSADGTAIFLLDRQGKAGLGLTPGSARLDLSGRADAGEWGLELRSGNSSSSVTSAQLAFGDAAGRYRHNIRTRAAGTQSAGNEVDVYLWTASDSVFGLGSFEAMSLQASTTAGQAGLHAIPSSTTVTAELVVSSGTVYAGGVILRGAAVGPPCYASLKTEIRHLGDAERRQAVLDLESLKPVSFRYKGDPGKNRRKGYIFEDSPQSVRGRGESIVVDERLMNLEMALQAALKGIESLEGELARLEGRGR